MTLPRGTIIRSPELQFRVGRVLAELSNKPREQLHAILPLFDKAAASVLECLDIIYPHRKVRSLEFHGKEMAKVLQLFTNFRAEVNRVAARNNINIVFKADRQTRSTPDKRECWFEIGDDQFTLDAMAAVGEVASIKPEVVAMPEREKTPDDTAERAEMDSAIDRVAGSNSLFVTPIGISTLDMKYLLPIYVFAERSDSDDVMSLMNHLGDALRASDCFHFELHSQWGMFDGGWKPTEGKAPRDCEICIACLSPRFFAAKLHDDRELRRFLPDVMNPSWDLLKAFPVALSPLEFPEPEKGISPVRFFRQQVGFLNGKSFVECSDVQQSEFAANLCSEIDDRLKTFRTTRDNWIDLSRVIIPNLAVPIGINSEALGTRVEAITFLETWAKDPLQPRYAVVLGESGIGKTTALKKLTIELIKDRQAGESAPLPIFLDLRHAQPARLKSFNLDAILKEIIAAEYVKHNAPFTPQLITRLVREDGALVIFDGLDEVLVHLSPGEGQAFFSTIMDILPFELEASSGKNLGKVAISCRSHYFSNFVAQRATFFQQDRGRASKSTFVGLLMLPFSEEQILEYLKKSKGEERGGELWERIRNIHNLPDVASRPYLLNLLSEQLEHLLQRPGEIRSVDIYERMVDYWLHRDDSKHRLELDYKRRIMEELAAEMWSEGAKMWKVEKLESWFDRFLGETRNEIYKQFKNETPEQLKTDQLKTDLRTATFIVRPDTNSPYFRFAHSSLQEFFLAKYMHRALVDGQVDRWTKLRNISRETMCFFAELLMDEESSAASMRTLRSALSTYRKGVTELVVSYALRAEHESNWPRVNLNGINLGGAMLDNVEFRGDRENLLRMRDTSFRGASLLVSKWEYVDLTGADFTGARLTNSEFLDVNAERVDFAGAWLDYAVVRRSNLDNACLQTAHLEGTDLTGSKVSKSRLPHGLNMVRAGLQSIRRGAKTTPVWQIGHHEAVNACAISKDGTRVATASSDRTAIIWEMRSGRELLRFAGHSGQVLDCAFSPDGKLLATASSDHAVRIWNAMTGALIRELKRHEKEVNCCDFNGDGTRLVSASSDGTVRLWKVHEGELVCTFWEHTGCVAGCAFAANGKRIVTASWDETAKVFDVEKLKLLFSLKHPQDVNDCVFSPDGSKILTASDDGVARVCDVNDQTVLYTLRGHTRSVRSCTYSADGKRILTSSHDTTARLWDAYGNELQVLGGHLGSVLDCAIDASPMMSIVTVSADKTTKFWVSDNATGVNVPGSEIAARLTLAGKVQPLRRCEVSAGESGGVITTSRDDGVLRTYDLSTGAARADLRVKAHGGRITGIAFGADGENIVTSSADGLAKVWRLRTGALLGTYGAELGPAPLLRDQPDIHAFCHRGQERDDDGVAAR